METEVKDNNNNNNKVNKDDEVDKDVEVDKDDGVEKDNEDMNKKEEEDEEFFFAKILKMTKYTSLPNLVRLGQWEQVSPYYSSYSSSSYWQYEPVSSSFAYAKI